MYAFRCFQYNNINKGNKAANAWQLNSASTTCTYVEKNKTLRTLDFDTFRTVVVVVFENISYLLLLK